VKQKFNAGSVLDILTKSELHDTMHDVFRKTLQGWYAEACIGTRFHRFSVQGTIAGNVLDMGGAKLSVQIGPADGFIWDIRRLHINGLTAGDKVSIGINDNQPSSVVTTSTDVTGFTWLFSTQLVLQPGESLKIYSTANLSETSGIVTLTGQVRELPIGQAWRLGGN
jgi:hypothetical protein